MFAVQLHNQALYHLSQLTTVVVTSKKTSRRVVSRGGIDNCVEDVPASFLEIKRQLCLDHRCLRNDSLIGFSPLCFISYKRRNQQRLLDSKWRTSYVSAASFALNKQGVMPPVVSISLQMAPLPFRSDGKRRLNSNISNSSNSSSSSSSSSSSIIRRHFKTDRSTIAAEKRSPTISSRVKNFFLADGMSPFFDVSSGSKTVGLFGVGNDALRNLERLPEDEAQKVKIAFAEGYAAGQRKGPNKALKLMKAVQTFILMGVIIGTAAMLLASASGTVFKLQLTSQVEVDAQDIDVTFNDVKGADEAKQELLEVVEFLKNPGKFSTLGGKLPKGVLLVGPPGTGKTLLARAVAGEAGVPFFHAAGSEFDEILVGQGARRVRDLFNAAKNRAPCVIFIDEIDAVGGKRTNSVLHPYANQTINQLLSEMDGFHQNEGVIVLGATNRKDDLDKALLRPGRFDVEVHVPIPDFTGRKDILNLYLSKIKCKDIDVDLLARGTTGFTGADLENMVNLAAIRAAIDGSKFVSLKHLEHSRDKVLMGPERKSRIPDEEANEITAYHEGGHAIVAYYTKGSHPIHKVTIMPRGSSLGHTAYIPEKEHYHVKKSELLATMDTMMGGRAAEELIFGPDKITSGAASDLKQATAIATHMVKDWGMSDKAGLRTYDDHGTMIVNVNDLGASTTETIDSEIKKLLHDSYERAKAILKAHAKEHKQLAEALLKYETLEADDVKAIMKSKKEEKA